MDTDRRKDRPAIPLEPSSDVCVNGILLKTERLRLQLSIRDIAKRMDKLGWGYYPAKIFRIEDSVRYCASQQELQDYLDCLVQKK